MRKRPEPSGLIDSATERLGDRTFLSRAENPSAKLPSTRLRAG
jgi:hypothetical protein